MRRWLSSGLVLAVLFTQFVTAAHACTQTSSAAQPPAATAMPCDECPTAATPDPSQLALCIQHCQSGSQSVDIGHAPVISAPALLSSYYTLPSVREPTWPAAPRAASLDALAAADPPHAILHCCRRD
jgi:hypothetical protein